MICLADHLTEQGKTDEALDALRTSSACLPDGRDVSRSVGGCACSRGQARSSHRRVARDHSVDPHLFASTSRPGRCSAGQRRRRRSGCRVPRGPEAGARLDRSDRRYWGRPWPPRAKSRKQSPTWSKPWSSNRTTPAAHFQPGPGSLRSRAVQSAVAHLNEAIRLRPDNVRCCGKRPGFWRRARIPRSAMERGRSSWPASDPAFRGPRAARLRCAGRCAGRNREVLRGRRRGRASVDDGAAARRQRWPTPSSSGLASTARACPIASRRRPGRLQASSRRLPPTASFLRPSGRWPSCALSRRARRRLPCFCGERSD